MPKLPRTHIRSKKCVAQSRSTVKINSLLRLLFGESLSQKGFEARYYFKWNFVPPPKKL